jgi:hypothetical protein
MKRIYSLLILLWFAEFSYAQKEWYFGMNIGPKYDHFYKQKSGSSASDAKLDIAQSMGATAGIAVGLNMDEKNTFETGLYRNNYVVNLTMTSSLNNQFFDKEVVNTLNNYLVPINFQRNFPLHSGRQVFWAGAGVSLLIGEKTDFTGSFISETKVLETNGTVVDQMGYVRYSHLLEGSIYTFNVNAGLDISMFENVFLSWGVNGRLGIAGTDQFLVELTDPSGKAVYKISNRGSSIQTTVGFKYFMRSDSKG